MRWARPRLGWDVAGAGGCQAGPLGGPGTGSGALSEPSEDSCPQPWERGLTRSLWHHVGPQNKEPEAGTPADPLPHHGISNALRSALR